MGPATPRLWTYLQFNPGPNGVVPAMLQSEIRCLHRLVIE